MYTTYFRVIYDTIFGGISNILKEHFELINGFSNRYFGWGAEDDDIRERFGLMTIYYLTFTCNIVQKTLVILYIYIN